MLFRNFTEKAQMALLKANECSKKFKHGYIGTEHILVGILGVEGVCKRILYEYDLEVNIVKQNLLKYLGIGEDEYFNNEFPLTPSTKELLDNSIEEAKLLGYEYVCIEHILLSLIKYDKGIVYIIFNNLKVDCDKITELLIKSLSKKDKNIKLQLNEVEFNETQYEKTSILDMFSVDLTKRAKENDLNPVIGRDDEIEKILQVLCRRIKANPCLIGEPGVGKSALVEGLAKQLLKKGKIGNLENNRIIYLDIASLIAGSKYRGEFEERFKKVIEEVIMAKNIILFIDEIHTIIGTGAAEGALDAANILKPYLARNEIKCIGATTIDEYIKYIEKDPALERRFQPIKIEEPSEEQTYNIITGIKDKYENYHNVKITNSAIKQAIKLSNRYINDRRMPDKAIDIIDEASAKLNIKAKKNKKSILKEEHINEFISKLKGVPINKLKEEEISSLINLEKILSKKIIGQYEAVNIVSKAIRRSRAGVRNNNRPIGSFIFLGQTGVGKTELCKVLAEVVFGNKNNIIRLDMSEYMEVNSLSKIIGAAPGYVGYEDGISLLKRVNLNPYSIILLDEIEKANKGVLNILLQILEDGKLTDSKGKVIDFKNTIIIMTSNLGFSNEVIKKELGFCMNYKEETNYKNSKNEVMKAVKDYFKPEFLNRVDDIVIFNKLGKEDLFNILDLMFNSLKKCLMEQDIKLIIDNDSKNLIIDKIKNLNYGARELRRIITKEVEDRISEEILKSNIKKGDIIKTYIYDNKIYFNCIK